MTEPAILDTLVQRLEEFRYRMEDNSALDYYGSQIADELNKILIEVDTMRLVEESRKRGEEAERRARFVVRRSTLLAHIDGRREESPADLATQNAPARSCNSGEGKDRTNTDQEEGTAMTSMTEAAVSTKENVRHEPWCTSHRTERDRDEVNEICRHAVTVGEATVDLEWSPSWETDHDMPIVLPEWFSCDEAGARDLAQALSEATRLIEEAK